MKITNHQDLPSTITNYMERDPYSRGDADFSVTQLIDSPRISHLQEINDKEMEVDVSDKIWTIMGSAVHHICEMGAQENHIVEERAFLNVGGSRVSGAVDVQEQQENGKWRIYDYKLTRSWSVMSEKPEWEKQLNIYRYLFSEAFGRMYESLFIIALVRDFSPKKAQINPNYPQYPVVKLEIPVWDYEIAGDFLLGRVKLHQMSRKGPMLPCIDSERWISPTVWAVRERGKSRARKLFDNRDEAVYFMESAKGDLELEERKGSYARCEGNYCGVRQWCDQYNNGE